MPDPSLSSQSSSDGYIAGSAYGWSVTTDKHGWRYNAFGRRESTTGIAPSKAEAEQAAQRYVERMKREDRALGWGS